jgi:hypothetical protein
MTETVPVMRAPGAIRLADILGAFSLASDLAMGLHTEHGARSCYIGMHIAQELGLPLEQRTDLYYAELVSGLWTNSLLSRISSSFAMPATLWISSHGL